MAEIELENRRYPLNAGESILDGLLRAGISMPHGCRGGACQSCLMVAEAGVIPPQAQVGLKAAQKQLNYFLSCQCVPQGNLRVRTAADMQTVCPARVRGVDRVAGEVLRIRLEPVWSYRPGQYLNIWHSVPDGSPLIRSYSIASVPGLEDFVELHVKVLSDGRFSRWAQDRLKIGDTLQVQGPIGQCIYDGGTRGQPLLMIGIGTGLAPLYGIARDALRQGHSGPIHMLLGGRTPQSFYLQPELAALARDFGNFHVEYLSQCGVDEQHRVREMDLYQYVKAAFPSTKGFRIYLCGAASFVRKMKKQCFLAGAAMQDIYADAFLPCS